MNLLKLLAALFMLLDHIGFYYFDVLPDLAVMVLRLLGRLAFPIFAWSVARGFTRTHNLVAYFVRMAGFALVSEVIIRLADHLVGLQMEWTNVLVTFTLAIVALTGYRLIRDASRDLVASLRPIPAAPNTLPMPPHFNVRISLGGITLDARLGFVLGSIAVLLSLATAEWLHADYGAYGILTVLCLYIATDRIPEEKWEQRAFMILLPLNLVFLFTRAVTGEVPLYWALMQIFSVMAIPLMINFRREKKPPTWFKYGFYLFYPLHILALCAIRLALIGPIN
jgi:hypothetical protein